ncbi:biotin transporter BioY [Marisediminicola antarctica]|uniref:Biotin transporter n=1 Tax=Marisediminicola antarctica TaxID=674079 RepID=A0A7L5AQH9_9MICO|nr:biotin transporter BioY [Marisediminicola antarctica]QHO70629.1 BioY family transporter [Marisediminicola antarctica]
MARRVRIDIRDITRIAIFAAIIAVLGIPGAIPAFGGAVPITAQTLGVMLAGAVLGSWRGAAAVLTFLALVFVGLPLLSGGRGGVGVFAGATVGYLIGWVFGAFVVGAIAQAGTRRPTWWWTALGCFVGGILVVYTFGIPLQSLITQLPLAETVLASAVFLPGDILKVVIATVITMALWRAYPRAFRREARGGEAVPATAPPVLR